MNCKKCGKTMANVYPEGTFIGKSRFGKEVGYSCVNERCWESGKKKSLRMVEEVKD